MSLINALLPFAGILAAALIIDRLLDVRSEFLRKFIHLTSGVAFYALSFYATKVEIIIVAAIFAVFAYVTRRSHFLQRAHGVDRQTRGAVLFPIGVGLAAFFTLPEHIASYQFGVLTLAFADTVATIFGHTHGIRPLFTLETKKTFEGAVAFFAATIVVAFIFPVEFGALGILRIALVAFILTVIEGVSSRGADNLFLPIVGAYLFQKFLL